MIKRGKNSKTARLSAAVNICNVEMQKRIPREKKKTNDVSHEQSEIVPYVSDAKHLTCSSCLVSESSCRPFLVADDLSIRNASEINP